MLVLNTTKMDRNLRTSFAWMIGLGFAAALGLSNSIVQPLDTIRQAMHAISEGEGDLTARLEALSQAAGRLSTLVSRFQV